MNDNFRLIGEVVYDPHIQSRIVKQEVAEDGSETFTDVDTNAIIEKYQIIDPTQVPYPSIEKVDDAPLPTAEEYAKWRAEFEEWIVTAPMDEQDYLLQAAEIRRRRSPKTEQKLKELLNLYILQTQKQEMLARIRELHVQEVGQVKSVLAFLPIKYEDRRRLIDKIILDQERVQTELETLIKHQEKDE